MKHANKIGFDTAANEPSKAWPARLPPPQPWWKEDVYAYFLTRALWSAILSTKAPPTTEPKVNWPERYWLAGSTHEGRGGFKSNHIYFSDKFPNLFKYGTIIYINARDIDIFLIFSWNSKVRASTSAQRATEWTIKLQLKLHISEFLKDKIHYFWWIFRSERCKSMQIVWISQDVFQRIFICKNRLQYSRERGVQSLLIPPLPSPTHPHLKVLIAALLADLYHQRHYIKYASVESKETPALHHFAQLHVDQFEPKLKGSIGEGPNHSNFSGQSSVKFRNFC